MPGRTGVNDTNATASTNLLTPADAWVLGDHTVVGDTDVYAIVVPPGMALRVEVVEGDRASESCESNGIDSRLTLFNGATQLADDDNDGRGFCSEIDGTGVSPRDASARNTGPTPLTFHLHVRNSSVVTLPSDLAGQFTYRLQVTRR